MGIDKIRQTTSICQPSIKCLEFMTPLLVFILLTACSKPTSIPATPVAEDCYISPTGSNISGNGSSVNPWAGLQHAIDTCGVSTHATAATVHVAAGEYNGSVTINRPITIVGAGSATTTIYDSTLAPQGAPNPLAYMVTIGSAAVSMTGMTVSSLPIPTGPFSGGVITRSGIYAQGANLTLSDVIVYTPLNYSVRIIDSPTFNLSYCQIGTDRLMESDVGIDIVNSQTSFVSTGTIDHMVGLNQNGNGNIDHVISIGLNANVTITNGTLYGSPVYWADGIRIQGASTVFISNMTITRPPNSAPANTDYTLDHDRPYAGVQVSNATNVNALVTIQDSTLSGFDTGIGMNLYGNQVLAQRNKLGGNISSAVSTYWRGNQYTPTPVVDFGGGSLGSVGQNDFGNPPPTVAILQQVPYSISACYNVWNVTDIPSRILSQDDPSRPVSIAPVTPGAVNYCP
jgi:hypothetical protein